jgi:hypothetical protein
MKNNSKQTPIDDLRNSALSDYEESSSSIHHFNSVIPKAINFYFDHLSAKENRENEFYKGAKFMGLLYLFIFMITILIAFLMT